MKKPAHLETLLKVNIWQVSESFIQGPMRIFSVRAFGTMKMLNEIRTAV